ncbi:MAG: hypothetical protein Q9196_007364, partial [Gyalolechia fulgens]
MQGCCRSDRTRLSPHESKIQQDPCFDIEYDFMEWLRWGRAEDCLVPLGKKNFGESAVGRNAGEKNTEENDRGRRPRSVKRVEDIFEKPQFYIEGMTANDVRQGQTGDCWLMSSVCTLSNSRGLLQRIYVARDKKVGVYGFVFRRDGEWIHEVIDDKHYLAQEDFHEFGPQRQDWLRIDMANADEEYRKVMQTGSKAFYFAQCRDPNATWLPLLEKAYAKAYGAIEGGWVG